MLTMWEQAEPILREKAYAFLDADPQTLLDGDGYVPRRNAHIVMARLIGYDDQIDEDGLRLQKVESVILRAIPRRLTYAAAETPPTSTTDAFKIARYVCQRGHAVVPLDPMYAPPDADYDMTSHTVRVLYLRYRRRA